MKINISVVMTTYNGEKYLIEQLDSLKNQTQQIDEVLIFDDCSTDKTPELIEQYIKVNKIDNWKLYKNKSNKGWRKNFIEGFKISRGEYLFPCDQDDVWEKNKIKEMVKIMEKNSNILLLMSNYEICYEREARYKDLNRISRNMKQNGEIQKYKFDEKFMYVIRPGCVYCCRKKIVDMAIINWKENMSHDWLLFSISNLLEGTYIFNRNTIKFRRHSSNATNGEKNRDEMYKKNILKKFNLSLELLLIAEKIGCNTSKIKHIKKEIEFNRLRIKLFKEKKIKLWFKLLIKYRKFYFTLKSWLGDLYYSLK